jgi:hypothetical protein
MSEECCAHLRVQYDPIKNEDGTLTPRWCCVLCRHEFVPGHELATVLQLKAEVRRRRLEQGACPECGSMGRILTNPPECVGCGYLFPDIGLVATVVDIMNFLNDHGITRFVIDELTDKRTVVIYVAPPCFEFVKMAREDLRDRLPAGIIVEWGVKPELDQQGPYR